jgi:hypothetical protein
MRDRTPTSKRMTRTMAKIRSGQGGDASENGQRTREETKTLGTGKSSTRWRVQRAGEDLEFFCLHYLRDSFDQPFGQAHRALGQALDAEPVLHVLAFRGWGKSTLVSLAETLRLLVTRRVDFAVLTGRSEQMTRTLVLQLRLELQTNEALRSDFEGLERGALWQHLRFALADGREVLGRPLGGTARGLRSLANRRPQLWVLDDLQELADGRRPERIRHVLDFIRGVVVPAMQPPVAAEPGQPVQRSLIRVVGTKMSEDCAMAKLEAEPGFATFRLDAEDGQFRTAADPARFPLSLLREQRALLGANAYAREYQNTAVSQEGTVRREWLARYRPQELAALPLQAAVYWDPAIRPGGDFKAIVSLALHLASGRYYVLDAFLERNASPDEQVRELYRQWRRAFDLSRGNAVAAYEANGMQRLMEYPLEWHRVAAGLPPLPLKRVVNTEHKEGRIGRILPLLEQGRFLFDSASPAQQQLMDQWVFWPRGGTDGPDAMHGAWLLLQGPQGGNGVLMTIPQRNTAWGD